MTLAPEVPNASSCMSDREARTGAGLDRGFGTLATVAKGLLPPTRRVCRARPASLQPLPPWWGCPGYCVSRVTLTGVGRADGEMNLEQRNNITVSLISACPVYGTILSMCIDRGTDTPFHRVGCNREFVPRLSKQLYNTANSDYCQ